MATPSQSQPRLAFGPFEMDTVAGELSKRGIPIRLGRQPCQILLALVRQPGDLVTREQLREELWRKDTFVDFEHGLNAAINKLRQALGDSAESPRYIETLPGRGYRFIASVQHVLPPVKTPAALVKVERPAAFRIRGWWPWAAAAAAVLIVTLLGLWLGFGRRAAVDPAVVQFTVLPPSGYYYEHAGTRQAFAVSPDGSRLAFTAVDAAAVYRIFVRDFSALEARMLPNTEGAHNLFWSPDGESLFAHIRGTLRRINPDGGSQQVLSELPALTLSGGWLPPGRILLGSRQGTFLVPATGGEPQAIKQSYVWPQLLPDGERILYSALDPQSNQHVARVARFDRPEPPKDLLTADSRAEYAPSSTDRGAGYLLYVRAGNLLAHRVDAKSLQLKGEPAALAGSIFRFHPTAAADFSVSANGVLVYAPFAGRWQMAWWDRGGREVQTVGPANLGVKNLRLSPDQLKVAAEIYDVERGQTAIWIYDSASGTSRRLTRGPGLAANPIWAPDSKQIVFLGSAGRPRLYVQGLGVNDPEEALTMEQFLVPSDWSPDGRYIAYSNTSFPSIASEYGGDVSVIDLHRERRVTAIINTPARESSAVFSPDGRSMAFIADDSGRPEIYVQGFQAGDTPRMIGERRQISRGGALYLRWQRDGRAIVYLGSDSRVYSVAMNAPGDPEPLFTIPVEARTGLPYSYGFDVSGDGRRFLVPGLSKSEPVSLVVVRNWERLVR